MSMRRKTFILALATVLTLAVAGDAFARPGQGLSLGSRGTRTYSTPYATPTNPYGAAPFNRSMSPSQNQNVFRPGLRSPGLFSGGLMSGLLSGFIGAGIFGLLFGHGLFGGLGGGFSLIGLLIQLGLIYLLVRFALSFFKNRNPAFFGGPQGAAYQNGGPVPGAAPMGGYGAPNGGAPLPIAADDFNMFEQRLVEVQSAYSKEDIGTLRGLVTPEMAAYFSEELAANRRRGVANRLSDTKLLKGDLSEAWRESGSDYASVAIRYSLIDTMVDLASGRVVSGNANVPDIVTEVWTFVRPAGMGSETWMLSAIQQA